jgi:hypothetical protein
MKPAKAAMYKTLKEGRHNRRVHRKRRHNLFVFLIKKERKRDVLATQN